MSTTGAVVDVPPEYLCPITLVLMTDPVISRTTGYTYERAAIEKWLQNNTICPITRTPLSLRDLIPNRSLLESIERYKGGGAAPAQPPAQSPAVEGIQVRAYCNNDATDTWVQIISPDSPVETEKKVLVLCLDVSGSMGYSALKPAAAAAVNVAEAYEMTFLEILIHGAKTLVQTCNKNHYIGIVTFSYTAKLGHPIIPATDDGKKSLIRYLESLFTEGDTNLYDGIRVSLNAVHDFKMQHPGLLSSVVLFTDGEPSSHHMPRTVVPSGGGREMTEVDFYINKLRSVYKSQYPAPISIFACGNNVNSKLADAISRETGGAYGFMADATFIGDLLQHFIAGFRCVRAQNVVLQYTILDDNNALKEHTHIVETIQYGQNRDILLVHDIGTNGGIVNLTVDGVHAAVEPLAPPLADEYCFHKIRHVIIDLLKDVVVNPSTYKEVQADINTYIQEQLETVHNDTVRQWIEAIATDFNGQIALSVEPQYYTMWGLHYLLSITRAYELQQANNFKDASVQFYGGERFKTGLEEAYEAFLNVPMVRRSRGGSAPRLASLNTTQMFNTRNNNGCFAGLSTIQKDDGSFVCVNLSVPGDQLRLSNGQTGVVECIMVSTIDEKTPLVEWSHDLWITEYHPIAAAQVHGCDPTWMFPIDHSTAPRIYRCNLKVYSIVLATGPDGRRPSGALVMANGKAWVASLGHGVLDTPILSHPYWGTEAVIEQLKQSPGYKRGIVWVDTFVHKTDADGYEQITVHLLK